MILARQFIEAGFQQTSTDEPADVYMVNTCTVTHIADRKGRQALRSARRRNPDATIVATGCYPQRSTQDLHGMEEIDLVIGNTDKASLVRQVMEWRGQPTVPCAVGDDSDAFSPRIARTRAMLKIQEGCDQVCAYCIVPKVRGRERSIPAEEIICEINRYAASGYKEVVLTGTQLGSYGFEWPDVDLTQLLQNILSQTTVERLRISSLQPQEISERLLQLWDDGRLCPHFHMPLQSGSDDVLRHMRRRYTSKVYEGAVGLIRKAVPGVSITADVIVGFPGETEADFQDTYALCQRTGFADLHVFPYSIRPGTSAAHFDGHVASETKTRGVQSLLELAKTHAEDFRKHHVGTERPVLWEGLSSSESETKWKGLTDNYIRVTCESYRPLANQITLAKLLSHDGDLVQAEPLI